MSKRSRSVVVHIGAVSSLIVFVSLIVFIWGVASGNFVNRLDNEIEFVIEEELEPSGTIGTQIKGVERLENQKIDAIDKNVKELQASTASLRSAVSKLQAQTVALANEIGLDVSKLEAEAAKLQGEVSADAGQIAAATAALADASQRSQNALAGICGYINSTARRKKDIPPECAAFQ